MLDYCVQSRESDILFLFDINFFQLLNRSSLIGHFIFSFHFSRWFVIVGFKSEGFLLISSADQRLSIAFSLNLNYLACFYLCIYWNTQISSSCLIIFCPFGTAL